MLRKPAHRFNGIGFMRLESVLALSLLACVLRANAQTLNSSRADNSNTSSNNVGDMLNSKHGSTGFDVANEGVSGAVDQGLQGYNFAVGVADFSGELAGSGGGHKTSTSAEKLLLSGSVLGISTSKIESIGSPRFHGSSGLSQKGIVGLPAVTGAAAQKLMAAEVLSRKMQFGSSMSAEEPESEDTLALETDSATTMETFRSSVGVEGLGESFKASHGSLFESLCAEGCSHSGRSRPAEGKHNFETHEQALAHHLSRSATRLSRSPLASDDEAGKSLGRIAAEGAKLFTQPSIGAKLSVGGSNDQ